MKKCADCNTNFNKNYYYACPNCGTSFCEPCAKSTKNICPKCYASLELK